MRQNGGVPGPPTQSRAPQIAHHRRPKTPGTCLGVYFLKTIQSIKADRLVSGRAFLPLVARAMSYRVHTFRSLSSVTTSCPPQGVMKKTSFPDAQLTAGGNVALSSAWSTPQQTHSNLLGACTYIRDKQKYAHACVCECQKFPHITSMLAVASEWHAVPPSPPASINSRDALSASPAASCSISMTGVRRSSCRD